jgi:hypothetical protein
MGCNSIRNGAHAEIGQPKTRQEQPGFDGSSKAILVISACCFEEKGAL